MKMMKKKREAAFSKTLNREDRGLVVTDFA